MSKARLSTSIWAVLLLLVALPAKAECGGFIRWSAETLDDYQDKHRIFPLTSALKQLAQRVLPALWVTPGSWKPIDFDRYLENSELFVSGQKQPAARGSEVRSAINNLDREAQCATWLKAPEQPAANVAPVYVQAYKDVGPNGDPSWTYLKYTYVFDWSGLAKKRSFVSRVGATFTGGKVDRWHRLDVHTSAIVGLDAEKTLRTLTLQQHNNKRTYVAGLDFPPSNPLVAPKGEPLIHLAAANSTNELYLDTGSVEPEQRRAVASFAQLPHLIDAQEKAYMWQLDEFVGRNSGGEQIKLEAVFIEPDHPLAAYAGLLAPKQRMLGVYVGRDGPPGYDFDGDSRLPETTVIGFWREGDQQLIKLLKDNIEGFQSTNWDVIADYLRPKLAAAISGKSL